MPRHLFVVPSSLDFHLPYYKVCLYNIYYIYIYNKYYIDILCSKVSENQEKKDIIIPIDDIWI